MPEDATMQLGVPDELGDPARFAAELEAMVKSIERAAADERRRTGRSVLGRARVLRQKWSDAPTTFEPRRTMSPRVAAINRWRRVEALLRNKVFVRAYEEARSLWREGAAALFPPGTYWLRRFANVQTAPS